MKSITIDEIEIHLYKNALAKKISIAVRPFKPVRVTFPNYVSYAYAQKFALEKLDWLKTTLSKTKLVEERQSILNEQKEFITRNHQLVLIPCETQKITISLYQNRIKIRYPNHLDKKSSQIQAAVKKGVLLALKKEAIDYLPSRIDELSRKFHLPFNQLAIKNIKSRWGSCSSKNNINLSIHLMHLPDHLIDYVILHELAHTVVKNHSSKYWQFLSKLTVDAKLLDKELKKHTLTAH